MWHQSACTCRINRSPGCLESQSPGQQTSNLPPAQRPDEALPKMRKVGIDQDETVLANPGGERPTCRASLEGYLDIEYTNLRFPFRTQRIQASSMITRQTRKRTFESLPKNGGTPLLLCPLLVRIAAILWVHDKYRIWLTAKNQGAHAVWGIGMENLVS